MVTRSHDLEKFQGSGALVLTWPDKPWKFQKFTLSRFLNPARQKTAEEVAEEVEVEVEEKTERKQ